MGDKCSNRWCYYSPFLQPVWTEENWLGTDPHVCFSIPCCFICTLYPSIYFLIFFPKNHWLIFIPAVVHFVRSKDDLEKLRLGSMGERAIISPRPTKWELQHVPAGEDSCCIYMESDDCRKWMLTETQTLPSSTLPNKDND